MIEKLRYRVANRNELALASLVLTADNKPVRMLDFTPVYATDQVNQKGCDASLHILMWKFEIAFRY